VKFDSWQGGLTLCQNIVISGYVIDLALTDDEDDGYNKIIEYNCCNCAGFYEIDIQKWVMAIENMEF